MAARRCAEWRFPTAKQQRTEETTRRLADAQRAREPAVSDEDAWWDAVLRDPRASTDRPSPAKALGGIRTARLRVQCLRCYRVVEELRRDLIARWGAEATWRDVGQRLLNERCDQRTGNHEEDGCWPDFR